MNRNNNKNNNTNNDNIHHHEDEKLTLEARHAVFKDLSIEEHQVFRSIPAEAMEAFQEHQFQQQQLQQQPPTTRSIGIAPSSNDLLGGLEPPSFAKIQPFGSIKSGPVQFMEFNPATFGFTNKFQSTQTQLQQQTFATGLHSKQGQGSRQSELSEQLDRILMATVMEMPAYVEKYTSFGSTKLPREIFERTTKALQGMPNVDFDLNGSLVHVSGTYYDGHVSARFQINLFKKERGYLVEVQRRCGDCLAFNHFFQALKEELSSVGVVEGQAKPADKPLNRAPPAYDILLDDAALSPLQSMAESDFVDVAREGMKMLAKCSMTPDNSALIGNKCLALLQRRLQSADEELLRYASFILSNITKTGNISREICTQAAAVDSVFQALHTADNKEIRRLLAQCAANFALVNTQAIANEHYRQVLRRHRASSDSRLASLVEATLARVDL